MLNLYATDKESVPSKLYNHLEVNRVISQLEEASDREDDDCSANLSSREQNADNIMATARSSKLGWNRFDSKIILDSIAEQCPSCGVRSNHYHGHSSHSNVRCVGCNTLYCYVCKFFVKGNKKLKQGKIKCKCLSSLDWK